MPKPPAVRIPIVVEQLSEFIREYVYLENPDLYLLIALWVLGTHLHMDFDYMGYLYAYSPEKQSGKSTLLKVLKPLVFNPSGPQVSPSPAVLFRLAKGYTQLLDEADSWTNMEELRNILNAGFEKGGVVQRCGGQRTNFKVETFEVYGPRALAGIGLNKLPETTQDRTFAISMVRQKRGEARRRYRPISAQVQIAALRKEIDGFVESRREWIERAYREANFPYLATFSDRTKDISEPLAAILEVAFNDHGPQPAREVLVRAIQATRSEQQKPNEDHKILLRLLEVSEQEDPIIGTAAELAPYFGNWEGDPVGAHQVTQTLRKFGMRAKSQRKAGEEGPRYRYVIRKSQLQDLVDRWVPKSTATRDSEFPSNGELEKLVVDVVGEPEAQAVTASQAVSSSSLLSTTTTTTEDHARELAVALQLAKDPLWMEET